MTLQETGEYLLDAIKAALTDRTIAYHPLLAKVCGSVEGGVLLSQLLYWGSRTRDLDGWIYKTEKAFQEETGLTGSNQKTVRKKLASLGILETRRRGVPATLHYRVDFNQLIELIEREKSTTGLAETTQLNSTKTQDQFGEKRTTGSVETAQLLIETESTTKTTQKITTENGGVTGQGRVAADCPEWFRPMESLHGFKNGNHKKFISNVEETCADPQVKATPALIVASFVPYYVANRLENGWSDPVVSLKRTLVREIAKVGKMTANQKTQLLSEVREAILATGINPLNPVTDPDEVTCETCQGQDYYLVGVDPVWCNHSGQRRTTVVRFDGDLDSCWAKVLDILRDRLPRSMFETWLTSTRFIGVDGGKALVATTSAFNAKWLMRRAHQVMEKELNKELGQLPPLDLVVVWEQARDGGVN